MTDWSALRHAYGDASDIPALLEQIAPDPRADVWNELWSRLCHQGTVYSASFAALPFLLRKAETWPPKQRAMAVGLAGAIVGSQDVVGGSEERTADFQAIVTELEHIALESLASPDLPASDFIYVAEAVLAFRGNHVWGHQLDRLDSGEFEGVCPRCSADLLLAVGQYGFFATAEEWVNRPATKRIPISSASRASLFGVQQWLYEQASTAGQGVIADWLLHLFGSTSCPGCGQAIGVADAVERASGPTSGRS